MYKVDLHTHSIASPDGGISFEQYKRAFDEGVIDTVAITDHNSVSFAKDAHEKLGDLIIVGEEIMTKQGEIIGLYLTQEVPPLLSPLETVKHIKDQGGIVYVPHPFETFRKGLSATVLEEIADYVDIIEVCNGRAFLQKKSSKAVVWTRLNNKDSAASSDAHGYKGLGRTYSSLPELPTKDTLLGILDRAVLHAGQPSLQVLLYPKYHRLHKKLRGSR